MITIIVATYKEFIVAVYRNCTGTVIQIREDSEKESEKRCDLRRQQKMEREGGSSDVRWKSVPQMSGCNRKRLSPTVDRR